jgi:hypothetical protein
MLPKLSLPNMLLVAMVIMVLAAIALFGFDPTPYVTPESAMAIGASRYIRDTVVLAKIETVYGTDSLPTGAANAMQVSNVRMTPLNAQFVSRDLMRQYFGASEELISFYNKMVSFDVEAVGRTAGVAPAWAPLIRAAGWSETLTATERAVYSPITNGQEAASMYVYDSGVLHKLLGARGGVNISMGLGGIPKLTFSFIAIDGGDTAATASSVSYANFQVPEVINNLFTGDLTMGATLTAPGVAPSFTGGTTFPSTGLEIDMGIKPEFIPLLGQETVEITDRKAKGKIKLDLTAAQEISNYATIKAGTLQSVGLMHGSVAGRKFGVFCPAAQIIVPTKAEMSGKRMMEYDLVLCPLAGNDEVQIVTSW